MYYAVLRCEARAGDGRVVQLPGGWEQLFDIHKVSILTLACVTLEDLK